MNTGTIDSELDDTDGSEHDARHNDSDYGTDVEFDDDVAIPRNCCPFAMNGVFGDKFGISLSSMTP